MDENATNPQAQATDDPAGHRPPQVISVQSHPIIGPPDVPETRAPLSILEVIDRAARDPSVDVAKMSGLLSLYERVNDREREAAFAAGMVAVQSELKTVRKGAENKGVQGGAMYATYEALDAEARPILDRHGFSVAFDTDDPPKSELPMVRVVARVSHRNGHSVSYKIDLPADGKGAKGGDVMTKTHAVGSAITYGRRYLLKMILNIVDSDLLDDDGNMAGTEYVTEQEAADLRALATEIGANIPAYLKVMRAETFEKIPASRFKDALATLEAKRRAS